MRLVRKNITSLKPYIAGKPIEETKRQFGLKKVIKLASNENPLGPSPKAVRAIKRALTNINRYPDSQSFYLKRRLAKALDISPQTIVLGNGSDELIDIIIKTFVEEDENIVTADNTFLEYEIIAKINNKKLVTVPLRYFKYDLNAIKNRVDRKTKLVFIANPNNPTGTYVTRYEMNEFLSGLPANVIVVIDEAYDMFIDVFDYPSGISYLKRKNVITLKTFSKAYGLAGLRLGMAVAPVECALFMERVRQPFNVNMLAQAAGLAALDDKDFLRKTKVLNAQGKRYLYDALSGLKLPYVPTVTNFILLDTGRDGVLVFKELLKYGVIVRDMLQYGLKNFIRVTIGTKKENELFIKSLRKITERRI